MSSVTNNGSGQPGGVCPSFENAPLDRRVFSLTLRCGEKFAFPHSRLSNPWTRPEKVPRRCPSPNQPHPLRGRQIFIDVKATDNSFDEFVARRSKLSLEWRIGNIYRFPFLLTNLKRFFPIKLKLRGYIFHPSTRIERNVFISSIPDISVHGKNYYTGKKKKEKKVASSGGREGNSVVV